MNLENLCFSGGGIKGIAFIGCLKALEEKNILKNIKSIIGTSAGSIMALFITLGYTSKQLKELCLNIKFNSLIGSINDLNTLITCFTTSFGLESGEKINKLITILIQKKNFKEDINFLELYNKTKINLIITGTCITNSKKVFFNYKETPEMKISEAVRISISIPLIFNFIKMNNKIYCDGALLNNYPIKYFKNVKNTLGFLVLNKKKTKLDNIKNYILKLFEIVSNELNKTQIANHKDNTLILDLDINGLDFSISKKKKNKIIDYSYNKTIEFILKFSK